MKMAAPKSTPKDAQVMAAILKDMGVTDYEPRVINLMLEFTYRYVTNILDDARIYSNHAKKKNLDTDDIRLAVQFRMDNSFTSPPPRDLLVEIARQKNNTPLPLIKPHCGTRLPPDRYCLSASNYKLKSIKKPKMPLGVPLSTQRLGLGGAVTGGVTPVAHPSSLATNMTKINPAVNVPSKLNTTLSLVTRGVTAPTVTIVTRPATTSVTKTITSNPLVTMATPTPVIQISQGSAITAALTTHQSASQAAPNLTSVLTSTKPYIGSLVNESNKRKREDDDIEGPAFKKEPV